MSADILPELVHYSELRPGDEIALAMPFSEPLRETTGFWGGLLPTHADGSGGFLLFLFDEMYCLHRWHFPVNPGSPAALTGWCNMHRLRRWVQPRQAAEKKV